MSKLTPITRIELIKRLRKFGFEGPFQGGKHQFMLKNDIKLTLPNPHKKEIGIALLSKILNKQTFQGRIGYHTNSEESSLIP